MTELANKATSTSLLSAGDVSRETRNVPSGEQWGETAVFEG